MRDPRSSKSLFIEVGVVNLPLGAGEAEATLRKEIEDFAKVFEGKIVSTARHDYRKDSAMNQVFPGMTSASTCDFENVQNAVCVVPLNPQEPPSWFASR